MKFGNPDKFIICCPGPSLKNGMLLENIRTELFDGGIGVAVNGAILADLPFEFWAMQDIEVFRSALQGYRMFYQTLWVPQRWQDDVKGEHQDLRTAYDALRKIFIPGESCIEAFSHQMPFCKELNWREFTLTMAIGMSILGGAKSITVYGADLCGQGYFRKGLENDRTRHDDRRWDEEKLLLATIMSNAALNGVDIFLAGVAQ